MLSPIRISIRLRKLSMTKYTKSKLAIVLENGSKQIIQNSQSDKSRKVSFWSNRDGHRGLRTSLKTKED